jgi:hypothetical protein
MPSPLSAAPQGSPRWRGWTRGSWTWCADSVPRCLRCRKAVDGCSPRSAATTRSSRSPTLPGRSRRASSPTPPSRTRCGASVRTAPGWPVARCRPRRTRAGRTPPSRPSIWADGCATSTRSSPPTGYRASRTGISATAASTAGSTSRSGPATPRRPASSATSCTPARPGSPGTAAPCRASTATAGCAPNCCPTCTTTPRSTSSPRSRRSAIRTDCSTPGSSPPPPRSPTTCARYGRAPGSRSPEAGTSAPPSTGAPVSASASRRVRPG